MNARGASWTRPAAGVGGRCAMRNRRRCRSRHLPSASARLRQGSLSLHRAHRKSSPRFPSLPSRPRSHCPARRSPVGEQTGLAANRCRRRDSEMNGRGASWTRCAMRIGPRFPARPSQGAPSLHRLRHSLVPSPRAGPPPAR